MIKVDFIDSMGTDLTVVNAARVSFGSTKDKLEGSDIKLMKYLADHQHMTPFEHMILSVKIECPIDIRSQIIRHRVFSYNEISRRYTSKDIELFEEFEWRKQHKTSKQCSDGTLSNEQILRCKVIEQRIHAQCLKAYNDLLDIGVSREQARRKLPIGLMTKFYMTGSVRNWVHFLKLRLDEHAQKEAQIVAGKVKDIMAEQFPIATKVLFGEKI